jgi:hypothetical protein
LALLPGIDPLRNNRPPDDAAAPEQYPLRRRALGFEATSTTLRLSVAFLVLVAVVVRVAQYAADRSLWLNEAALALNLLNRGFFSLTGELDFNQGAPVGFLLIEKVAAVTIGSSEYALRAFPLLCGIASVYFFLRLAQRLLSNWAVAMALMLFATASGPIYYASEVKQYSTDLAATLLLTLLAVSVFDGRLDLSRNVAAAVVGMFVIATSHAAVFVALAIVLVFGTAFLRSRPWHESTRFLPVLVIWSLSGAIAIGLSVFQLAHLRETVTFTNGFSFGSELHAFNKLATAVGESLGFLLGPEWLSSLLLKLAAVVSVIGAVSLFVRERALCLILVLPGLLAYIANAAHIYPVFARTTLFLVPAGIIVLAEGVARIVKLLPRFPATAIATALVISICGVPASYAAYHLVVPRHHEELRPVLEEIRSSWRPGDSMYLHYGAQYAFLYYLQCGCVDLSMPGSSDVPLWQPRTARFGHDEFAPAIGSRPPHFFVGPYAPFDANRNLSDLRRLRGQRRVWIIYTHLSTPAELRFVTGPWLMQLDRMGKRLRELHGTGVHAFLYDFHEG